MLSWGGWGGGDARCRVKRNFSSGFGRSSRELTKVRWGGGSRAVGGSEALQTWQQAREGLEEKASAEARRLGDECCGATWGPSKGVRVSVARAEAGRRREQDTGSEG